MDHVGVRYREVGREVRCVRCAERCWCAALRIRLVRWCQVWTGRYIGEVDRSGVCRVAVGYVDCSSYAGSVLTVLVFWLT